MLLSQFPPHASSTDKMIPSRPRFKGQGMMLFDDEEVTDEIKPRAFLLFPLPSVGLDR